MIMKKIIVLILVCFIPSWITLSCSRTYTRLFILPEERQIPILYPWVIQYDFVAIKNKIVDTTTDYRYINRFKLKIEIKYPENANIILNPLTSYEPYIDSIQLIFFHSPKSETLNIINRIDSRVRNKGYYTISYSFVDFHKNSNVYIPPEVDTCILKYDIRLLNENKNGYILIPMYDTLIRSSTSKTGISIL